MEPFHGMYIGDHCDKQANLFCEQTEKNQINYTSQFQPEEYFGALLKQFVVQPNTDRWKAEIVPAKFQDLIVNLSYTDLHVTIQVLHQPNSD